MSSILNEELASTGQVDHVARANDRVEHGEEIVDDGADENEIDKSDVDGELGLGHGPGPWRYNSFSASNTEGAEGVDERYVPKPAGRSLEPIVTEPAELSRRLMAAEWLDHELLCRMCLGIFSSRTLLEEQLQQVSVVRPPTTRLFSKRDWTRQHMRRLKIGSLRNLFEESNELVAKDCMGFSTVL